MLRAGKIRVSMWCVVVAAIAVIYYVFDPSTRWAPKCAFHAITGYDCPGCGSQRMLHALLHGDVASAWAANPFLLCLLPLLALFAFAAARRTRFPRLYALLNSLPVIIGIAIALIAWTILRNL